MRTAGQRHLLRMSYSMRGRIRPQVRGAKYTHVHIKEFVHYTPLLAAEGHFVDDQRQLVRAIPSS